MTASSRLTHGRVRKRERWGTLPHETRAYISKRESEAAARIYQQGQELARLRQLEPLSKWVEQFPEDMPREEVLQRLEQQFGQSDATATMRQMAQAYERDYEPLRETLNQFGDVLGDTPAHEALASMLARERALRTNPAAIKEYAAQYGYSVPQAEHVAKLETELNEYRMRENDRAREEFFRDKPYLSDPQMQSALAAEMRQLQQQTPGLKGTALLKLAHDNLAERTGINKQMEQIQEQRLRQWIEERDMQWSKLLAEQEAEQRQRDQEREAQRIKEAEAKTKAAKRMATLNLKGSPVTIAPARHSKTSTQPCVRYGIGTTANGE